MKKLFVLATAGLLSSCGGGGGSSSNPGSPPPVVTPSPTPTPAPTPVGPNVVIIFADDLNDYIEPLQGHPQAYTPNFARIASKGVSFTNAHANAPLCSPSRASFLSGYLPSTTGKYHSTLHFRDHPVLSDAKLFPEHFRDNGYAVYTAGKIFHEGQNDNRIFGNSAANTRAANRDDRSGGYFGPMSEFGPNPWDGLTYINGQPARDIPYGIEGVDWQRNSWGGIELLAGGRWNDNPQLPVGLSDYFWGFGRLSQPPAYTAGMNSSYPAGYSYRGFADTQGPFRYVSETDRSLISDERIARWSSELLRGRRPTEAKFAGTAPLSGQSFMMLLGLTKTHAARYVPDSYVDEFIAANNIHSIADVQLPQLFEGKIENTDLADVPRDATYGHGPKNFVAMMKAGLAGGSIPDLVNPGKFIPNTKENLLRSQILAYLVSVYEVDQQLGVILDALEAKPDYLKNTIVIVTSDHGWSAGEKTSWGKMSLFNESTRIPLIIADFRSEYDATRGTVSDVPVSLVDLYPTLVQLSALKQVPVLAGRPQLDGQSLVPALINPASPAMSRTPFAITSNFSGRADTAGVNDRAGRNHTIRGAGWRYTLSRNAGQELYNEQSDPNEFYNLYARAEWQAQKAQLDAELRSRVGM